jgi:hypothetical protein
MYFSQWHQYDKILVHIVVKTHACFYEACNFIIVFTRGSTGSYPKLEEFSSYPHTVPVRIILILSPNIKQCLPSGLFSLKFHTNILYALIFVMLISREFYLKASTRHMWGKNWNLIFQRASILCQALDFETFTPEKALGKRVKRKIRDTTAWIRAFHFIATEMYLTFYWWKSRSVYS